MYTIALQDAPADITELARADAEHRFRRMLERVLGGPEQVLGLQGMDDGGRHCGR